MRKVFLTSTIFLAARSAATDAPSREQTVEAVKTAAQETKTEAVVTKKRMRMPKRKTIKLAQRLIQKY